MAVLDVQNISYKYSKGSLVLDDLSMTFKTGKVYAILGESGSGKTTLLSLLAGLDVCQSGHILYNGADLKKINRDLYRARNVGMVFQQFNLLHRFNAVDNVLMAMEISKYKTQNSKQYVESLLEELGIDEQKRRRKVIELSGGEQQRVAIARALSHQPEIILADEPTGSLDEKNQKAIIDSLIKSAKADDKSIVISTHSRDVAQLADVVFEITRL
jgi:putative ABC transport system ATP-binding protein